MSKPKKVALAYSGGLDTSIIIPWLKENYGCEVVAVCGDIGQGGDELTGLEAKARATGASEVHVADMREEFVSDYLWRWCARAASMSTSICWGLPSRGRCWRRSKWKWRWPPVAMRWRMDAPARATIRSDLS